jgi:hypothetical protein
MCDRSRLDLTGGQASNSQSRCEFGPDRNEGRSRMSCASKSSADGFDDGSLGRRNDRRQFPHGPIAVDWSNQFQRRIRPVARFATIRQRRVPQ